MYKIAIILGAFLLASSPSMAGDVYAPLTSGKGELVGLCSAENVDSQNDIWEVRARHVNLFTHSAYSSWATPAGSSPQHLDGTITGSDKSYVFQGRIDGEFAESISVLVLDHGKPDPNNLVSQVATPSGGCGGPCPSVGGCTLSLE